MENMINDEKQKKIDPLTTADAKLYLDALEFAIKEGFVSSVKLQRRFCIGYPRAADIFEWMEEQGFIQVKKQTEVTVVMTMDEFVAFRANYNV